MMKRKLLRRISSSYFFIIVMIFECLDHENLRFSLAEYLIVSCSTPVDDRSGISCRFTLESDLFADICLLFLTGRHHAGTDWKNDR